MSVCRYTLTTAGCCCTGESTCGDTLRNLVSCGVYRLAHVDGPKFLPPAPMAALPGIFKLLQQKDTMIPLLVDVQPVVSFFGGSLRR